MDKRSTAWVSLTLALALLVPSNHALGEATTSSKVIDTFIQDDTETPRDFLQRVAQAFRRHTQDTGHEVGGYVCFNEHGRMGIFMATSEEQMYVLPIQGCPLDTPTLSSHFIHSHPEPGIRMAYVIVPGKAAKRQLTFVSQAGQRRFSTSDYAMGPGYLVAGRHLIHQRGRHTECLIMDLEVPEASPVKVSKQGKILSDQPCVAQLPVP